MYWIKRQSLLAICFFIASCGDQMPSSKGSALPFPTPAQHDLVVLTRPGLLTYATDDNGNPIGLEYDLTQAFAQELGVGIKYLVVSPQEIEPSLQAGKAHLAVAWLPLPADNTQKATPAILQSTDVLIQHEASLPLNDRKELRGRTVHALSGSR